MNSQGLAIINLRLSTIDKRGDPYQAVVNYLEPFFSPDPKDKVNGLNSLCIDFKIDPTNFASLERHKQIVNGFVQQMCQYVPHLLVYYPHSSIYRLGVKRLVVFVYTHSNPECGDLHCAEGGALTVADVSLTLSHFRACI